MKEPKIFGEFEIMRGIVEDNDSPKKDGRVRVRIPGLHPQKDSVTFESVSTEDLPWLEVMSSGFLSKGVGTSQILQIDSWVYVIVPDNLDEMVVLGQIKSGFEDLNETQKGNGQPILSSYSQTVKNVTVNEPEELDSKTEYPFSTSFQSQSSHLMIQDDTPGNERVKVQHRTGQFFEFRPDGTFELRTPKDGFLIVEGDLNQAIEKTVNVLIKEKLNMAIQEQVNINALQTLDIDQDGILTIKSSQGINIESSGPVKVQGSVINLN